MPRFALALLAAAGLALGGCTSLETTPVSAKESIALTCIRFNPDNNVDDLVTVIQARFQYHGIQTMVVKDAALPSQCHYVLEYTADRWWDLSPYMVDAKLTLTKDGVMIGSGHYHLNGHGGLDLDKWAGTASKLDPVIDGMLRNDPRSTGAVPLPTSNVAVGEHDTTKFDVGLAGNVSSKDDLYTELLKLDDLRKKGIITDAEFDAQKRKLLESAK